MARDGLAADRAHGRARRAWGTHPAWLGNLARSRRALLAGVSSRALRSLSRRSLESGTGRLRATARSHWAVTGRRLGTATGSSGARRRLGTGVRGSAVGTTLGRHRALTGRVVGTRAARRTVGTGSSRRAIGAIGTRATGRSLRPRLDRTSRQAGARYNTLLGSIQANAERLRMR